MRGVTDTRLKAPRPDMKRLFEAYLAAERNDRDRLSAPFLHFPPGSGMREVSDWFRDAHRQLDAAETPRVAASPRRVSRARGASCSTAGT